MSRHSPAHRLHLFRKLTPPLFGAKPKRVLICMLNPSTADETTDDRTVTRCKRFAEREGGSELVVVNLFTVRATKPTALKDINEPTDPRNDELIAGEAARSHLVIAAWRVPPTVTAAERAQAVLKILRRTHDVYRFGPSTMDGHPRHPVRLASNAPLEIHVRRDNTTT